MKSAYKYLGAPVLMSAILGGTAMGQTPRYLSDLNWTSATSGWGPVERDRSNGETLPGDGGPLTLNGQVYAKGLGVHAYSEVHFSVGGCSRFSSDVGIDDEMATRGSVVFQVWADGTKLFDSGIMTGASPTKTIDVDVSGRNDLSLIVSDGGDNINSDHGDWANAQFSCPVAASGPPSFTPTAPIVLTGRQSVTISGVSIQNPNGPCIIVQGNSSNIRIENSDLGPCLGGIVIDLSASVTVNNAYIHDSGTQGNGIDVTFSHDVTLTNNRIERHRTGVYVLKSTAVVVDRNSFLNALGPLPFGNLVQFNQVYGRNNRVTCNKGQDVLGQNNAQEGINMYWSDGTPDDPIQIVGNTLWGGGPSPSSGGILLGDGGGSYQVARNNTVVDTGTHGVSVASGHDMAVLDNRLYARQQSFTNVGIAIWNQYPSTSGCYNIQVQGNQVKWSSSSGQNSPYWNAGNCGSIAGFTNNVWNAALDASLVNAPIAECAQ